jgi:hypothetical protein
MPITKPARASWTQVLSHGLPRAVQTAVIVSVVALGSGCGTGSSNSNTGGGQDAGRSLTFAVCMRSHGISRFPDPKISYSGNHGQITLSLSNLDVGSPRFKSAQQACERLSPGGGVPTAADSRAPMAEQLRYSLCMRSHRVPNFPDPDKQGGFTFENRVVNPNSSQFQMAQTTCGNLLR